MNKLIMIFVLMVLSSFATAADWKSNCPKAPDGCQNVGKVAHNNAHWLKPGKMRDTMESISLGEIVGVIWRTTGSLISYSPDERMASEDAWYYIVRGGDGSEFIKRMCDTKPI